MFWKLTALSASSPVESILDKENFTLEELLDEEEIIQECKALNSRLINFLRDRAQVEQLLRYIVEESPENAESKQEFKFPFIACEVFTCEIDVILKTLVEEEELMDLLFSFLEPNRPHSMLLAGYFSKVVVCLMMRKTVALMNYVQGHQDVLSKLVDLIGITSIMEILVRLVGADDHVYPNFVDVMHWLSESYLLEMIVDKLNPSCSPEVHSNAAETLCAIACNAPSALATKLSSPSFVARIFGHALEDSSSKSSRVHSLGVLISLLDPKRSSAYSQLFHSYKNQHVYQYPVTVDPETINAMLPKLGDLLMLLNVSSNENVLPTSYGELRPPLGKYRLKIVEFIAVLLKPGNEAAERELVISGMIKRIIDLFFEYPYNNALHHHVESIILSCLESKNDAIVDHLFQDCDLVGKFLQVDKSPTNFVETNKPTLLATGKWIPRPGNMGHITRISNKLVQLGKSQRRIEAYLLENIEWTEWQATVLLERNVVENVYRWACGRPTALQERTRDSDEDDLNDRDYDIPGLANNLTHPFRYRINENEDATEDHRALDRDDEGDYYDDESAEVVISSLSLGDNQGSSLFTNSNWFAFEDNKIDRGSPVDASMSEMMDVDEIVHLNGTLNGGGNSSSDDEVVVGADEEMTDGKNSVNGTSTSCTTLPNGSINPTSEREAASNDLRFFKFDTSNSRDLFGDRSLPDWVEWGDSSDFQVGGSSKNPFEDHDELDFEHSNQAGLAEPKAISPAKRDTTLQNGSPTSRVSSDGSSSGNSNTRAASVPSLFEEDVEFVGVELEGTEKAMDHALKEGIVGEAGPLKRNMVSKAAAETDNLAEGGSGNKEFNDANYWRVDQEVAILE